MPINLRCAIPSDIKAVARLHRMVRIRTMPYLPILHTPEEHLAYFRDRVFPSSEIWLAEEAGQLLGFAAASGMWLDHLYVDPDWHGQGIGSALLFIIKKGRRQLDVGTFQQNFIARSFYEKRGFVPVRFTDGSENEEQLPDVHYRWTAD